MFNCLTFRRFHFKIHQKQFKFHFFKTNLIYTPKKIASQPQQQRVALTITPSNYGRFPKLPLKLTDVNEIIELIKKSACVRACVYV